MIYALFLFNFRVFNPSVCGGGGDSLNVVMMLFLFFIGPWWMTAKRVVERKKTFRPDAIIYETFIHFCRPRLVKTPPSKRASANFCRRRLKQEHIIYRKRCTAQTNSCCEPSTHNQAALQLISIRATPWGWKGNWKCQRRQSWQFSGCHFRLWWHLFKCEIVWK